MKAKILTIEGKEKGTLELPSCFSEKIREDLISKVIESKKTQQPFSPSPIGGKQHSASGKIVHRRHVWKSGYGRGMSRVPRKILSRRGSQFNWVGAEVPQARGGRRAHPPKIISRINTLKINKKEFELALKSALSATADEKMVSKKYLRLADKKISNLPFIVEGKITELKTKDFYSSIKKILGELYEIALKKKTIRTGKGKARGRKYKTNAGILLVVGKNEKLKTKTTDFVSSDNLTVNDLAGGGAGRLAIYTENSIKELAERFKGK